MAITQILVAEANAGSINHLQTKEYTGCPNSDNFYDIL